MARKTLSERKADKLAELNRIKAELAELESKAAERIGKIAIAAGLGDLDIDDAAMRKEFEAIASKFRKGETSKLLRLRQRLARTDRDLGRLRMNARREDARRKIQLGGLVIKSGMADYPASVILGALTLAAGALKGPNADDAAKARFEAAGDEAFSDDGEDGGNRS
jgi:hypothetical protein